MDEEEVDFMVVADEEFSLVINANKKTSLDVNITTNLAIEKLIVGRSRENNRTLNVDIATNLATKKLIAGPRNEKNKIMQTFQKKLKRKASYSWHILPQLIHLMACGLWTADVQII